MNPTPRVKSDRTTPKPRFPWVLVLALVATAYVFWVLPTQLEARPVQFEYAKEPLRQ